LKNKHEQDQVLYDIHNHCVNLNLREIYIHGYYKGESDEEPGVDWRQSTAFIKNLHLLDQEPHSPILVHLHSDGGCWQNGMAIYNTIQFSVSAITILSYSQASSMSGIILQAAVPYRIMMPDCHFMLHHGSLEVGGTSQAVKSAVDFNERACQRMLDIFAENVVKGNYFSSRKSSTKETVMAYLDKKMQEKSDWYMDAEEAVHFGFADAVLGDKNYPDMASLR